MTGDGLPGDLIAHLVAEDMAQAEEVTIADLRMPPSAASRGTGRVALENIAVSGPAAKFGSPGR